jgi:hypothetical protein
VNETKPQTFLPNGDWITGHALKALQAKTPTAEIEAMLTAKFGLTPGEVAWVLRAAHVYARTDYRATESAA